MIGCADKVTIETKSPLEELLMRNSYVDIRFMVKKLSVPALLNIAKAIHGVMYERFKMTVEEV